MCYNGLMLIVSFVQWWYGRGFKEYLASFVDKLKDLADFFSIRLLIRNLFAPFRQIAAEKHENLPLNARLRAWSDLLISRMVGATIRFFLLVIGMVLLVIRAVVGLVIMALWPLVPLVMAYAVMLYARGVVF